MSPRLLSCLVSITLCVIRPVFAQEQKGQDIIRVCILKDAGIVSLAVNTGYKIYSLGNNELIKEGKFLYKVKITATPEGILLGKELLRFDRIRIRAIKDGRIFLNKWHLRGDIDILKTKDLKLVIVNNLGVEDYLYGVLYHEVSHHWPYEVLKAQAIAARTYALYQKQAMQGKDYDVTADIYSQVYGGRTSEKYSTNRAVDLTKGKILTYNGAIFPAYYHATCGGFTEDASNLWNIGLPPLTGVECKFCKKSKHFKWKRNFKLNDIKEALQKASYNVGDIVSIKIEGRNKSNRINNVIVTSSTGDIKIAGKDFRSAIGPNLLRSNNYDIEIVKDAAIVKGIGWGHGVGMCQWGAYFMARKGYKAAEILKYYYPGAELK